MLDCFTHTGSFALNAATSGAESVLGVDASELGVEQAKENAVLNNVQDKTEFICRDVFELLPELVERASSMMWLFLTLLHLPNPVTPLKMPPKATGKLILKA